MRWLGALVLLTLPAAGVAAAGPTFHGKTLKSWIADLDHKDVRQRCRAATALGLGPFGSKAVPPLLARLKTRDGRFREHLLDALSCIGPEARAALPFLAAMIEQA